MMFRLNLPHPSLIAVMGVSIICIIHTRCIVYLLAILEGLLPTVPNIWT